MQCNIYSGQKAKKKKKHSKNATKIKILLTCVGVNMNVDILCVHVLAILFLLPISQIKCSIFACNDI